MGVLRFHNAVSEIGKFIETFCTIYGKLRGANNFDHDDAVKVLIENGLASSSGAIGQEALRRSTRDDRSRDPLYNQHKSYSEAYRMLGWYHPGSQRTNFIFSELAQYVNEATAETKKRIFAECVLNITFPNPHVENRAGNVLRPFSFLLKLMSALGGIMNRDEMILSVLAVMDDRNNDTLEKQKKYVESIRGNQKKLDAELINLAKVNAVQVNTFRNYTRFVLGAISYCDWAVSVTDRTLYKQPILSYKLTEKGFEEANRLNALKDIRNEDLQKYSIIERGSFTLLTHYLFLERVGYPLNAVMPTINKLTTDCSKIFNAFEIAERMQIMYSPFQQSKPEEIKKANELDRLYEQ